MLNNLRYKWWKKLLFLIPWVGATFLATHMLEVWVDGDFDFLAGWWSAMLMYIIIDTINMETEDE